jgi:hypothetical protein
MAVSWLVFFVLLQSIFNRYLFGIGNTLSILTLFVLVWLGLALEAGFGVATPLGRADRRFFAYPDSPGIEAGWPRRSPARGGKARDWTRRTNPRR